MFNHLLVPLDGSRLAEVVLPAAAYLAQCLGASVTLVHVIERDAPEEVHGERHLADPDEALAYLDEVATRAFPAGTHVDGHVHTTEVRDVARSIVEHVDELNPDLIVMCTHGRGGPRNWLVGSIAQQVIALGTTPVLLIQPDPAGAPPEFQCRHFLVPLDGDPDHEPGLFVAAGLAQACGASLHLMMVVYTFGTLQGQRRAAARLLPGAASAWLEISEQGAKDYLGEHMVQLQQAGLAVTASVVRGDPTTAILHTAQEVGADTVVLGTHGRAGMDAFWSGSVAAQVASRSRLPLLLVPVREAAAGS
jgi:nucleotide-binding universal stress UspA family protein